jgi:hypothetical protein
MRDPATTFWRRLWPGRTIGLRAIFAATLLWLLLHVVLFAGSGKIASASSFKVLLLIAAIASIAGIADLKRNRESVFLQNLGVAPLVVPAIWVGVMLLLELVTAIVLP